MSGGEGEGLRRYQEEERGVEEVLGGGVEEVSGGERVFGGI